MKSTVFVIAMLFSQFCSYGQQDHLQANLSGTATSVSIFEQGIKHVADSGVRPIIVAPWFVERFKISAGFFVPISNTSIEVSNKQGNNGTDIDFEDDLGFKRSAET